MTASTNLLLNSTSPCLRTLVEDLLSSNIQYLDHQINRITRPFQFSITEYSHSTEGTLSKNELENMFFQYERFSRKKWLLLHVKTLLTKSNATLILNLLSDNYLCEFEKEELNLVLNGSSEIVHKVNVPVST